MATQYKSQAADALGQLTASVSFIDLLCLKYRVSAYTENYKIKTNRILHKLKSLGACASLSSCNPSDVIFNLSDKHIVTTPTVSFFFCFGFLSSCI